MEEYIFAPGYDPTGSEEIVAPGYDPMSYAPNDFAVGGDARVAGNTLLKGDLLVEGWAELPNLIITNIANRNHTPIDLGQTAALQDFWDSIRGNDDAFVDEKINKAHIPSFAAAEIVGLIDALGAKADKSDTYTKAQCDANYLNVSTGYATYSGDIDFLGDVYFEGRVWGSPFLEADIYCDNASIYGVLNVSDLELSGKMLASDDFGFTTAFTGFDIKIETQDTFASIGVSDDKGIYLRLDNNYLSLSATAGLQYYDDVSELTFDIIHSGNIGDYVSGNDCILKELSVPDDAYDGSYYTMRARANDALFLIVGGPELNNDPFSNICAQMCFTTVDFTLITLGAELCIQEDGGVSYHNSDWTISLSLSDSRLQVNGYDVVTEANISNYIPSSPNLSGLTSPISFSNVINGMFITGRYTSSGGNPQFSISIPQNPDEYGLELGYDSGTSPRKTLLISDDGVYYGVPWTVLNGTSIKQADNKLLTRADADMLYGGGSYLSCEYMEINPYEGSAYLDMNASYYDEYADITYESYGGIELDTDRMRLYCWCSDGNDGRDAGFNFMPLSSTIMVSFGHNDPMAGYISDEYELIHSGNIDSYLGGGTGSISVSGEDSDDGTFILRPFYGKLYINRNDYSDYGLVLTDNGIFYGSVSRINFISKENRLTTFGDISSCFSGLDGGDEKYTLTFASLPTGTNLTQTQVSSYGLTQDLFDRLITGRSGRVRIQNAYTTNVYNVLRVHTTSSEEQVIIGYNDIVNNASEIYTIIRHSNGKYDITYEEI